MMVNAKTRPQSGVGGQLAIGLIGKNQERQMPKKKVSGADLLASNVTNLADQL